MAEEQVQEPIEQEEEVQEEPQGEADGIDWKEEARKWEKRAKAGYDAEKELKELKESQMSEQERAQRDREELALLKAEKEQAGWAKEVAKETSDVIPASIISDFFSCSTKEDAESLVDALVKHFKTPSAPIVQNEGEKPERIETQVDWLREQFTK